jgi:hypothetical protein
MVTLDQWIIFSSVVATVFVIGFGLGYFKGWSDWF